VTLPTDPGTQPEASPPSDDEKPDGRLLELLVCPLTKSGLDYDPVRGELVSQKARLAYPIRRGVPHMVPSEARNLDT
jgi:uncharacterized protein YbaR (Trm112 family)